MITKKYAKEDYGTRDDFDPVGLSTAFSMLPSEKKKAKDHPPVFLGWEFEVSNNCSHENDFRSLYNYVNLRIENGNVDEIVSTPMTMLKHKFLLSRFVKFTNIDNPEPDEIGMHIHIDKKSFTTGSAINFYYFINMNEEFISAFSGRESGLRYHDWCAINPDALDHIKIGEDGKLTHTDSVLKELHDEFCGKGGCINERKETYELRIFGSPSTKEKMLSNIEFAEAVTLFVRDKRQEDLTVAKFKEFVTANKGRYNNLVVDPALVAAV